MKWWRNWKCAHSSIKADILLQCNARDHRQDRMHVQLALLFNGGGYAVMDLAVVSGNSSGSLLAR